MNFDLYQAQALQTAKPLEFYDDLHHAALGLLSEAGEICDALKAHQIYGKPLDITNIKEEVGDALWFSALAARLANVGFAELRSRVGRTAPADAKRRISYAILATDAAATVAVRFTNAVDGRPFVVDHVASELIRYMQALDRIAETLGFTLEEAAEANIAKLSTRYPDRQFSAEAGLNRDKTAERAAVAG